MLTVGVLLLSGSRAFDLAVVGEVWGRDWSEEGIGRVELRWCSVGRANTRTSPYGELRATHGLSGLTECALVLVGGRRDHTADVPPPVCRALRRVASSGAMIASLCAGSFTLAAAGLLDHRQATTHWMLLDALQRAAPTADIRRDVLFTDDGDLLTSAGAVGGLDLNLHLLRRHYGAESAAAVARRLVMPPIREGGQRQYADLPLPTRSPRTGIASTMDWAITRLAEPIGVGDLRAHAGMSTRTLHREFLAATGVPPGRWLRAQRIRYAQRLLETTELPVERVARSAGLGTAANLRRRLHAELGVGPDSYRRTFRQPR